MRAFADTGGALTPPERWAGPRIVLLDDMRRRPDLLTAAGR
jgi:hypothetical protein